MTYNPRLRDVYDNEIRGSLQKEFDYSNVMEIPKLDKIVLNMGVGAAVNDSKKVKKAVMEMAKIAGQAPVTTRAKKSIAGFKVREEMPLGCKVTLRGAKMYEFLDRLIQVALPRVRDFRGISGKAFDGRGNYTLGLKDQLLFPEVDFAKVDKARGMNISIITTAQSDEEGRALLRFFGMPFRQN